MARIDDVLSMVVQHLDLTDIVGEMTEDEILKAEGKLGLRFPPSYRKVLSSFGSLTFGCEEFYGLTRGAGAGVPNVVWYTGILRERGLPHEMVPVVNPGIGDVVYCIDTSRADDAGESPVVEWELGLAPAEQNLEPISPTFADFALERMRWALRLEESG